MYNVPGICAILAIVWSALHSELYTSYLHTNFVFEHIYNNNDFALIRNFKNCRKNREAFYMKYNNEF